MQAVTARCLVWALAAAIVTAGCAPLARSVPARAALPVTRAESSGFTETSRYADASAFLDSLRKLDAPLLLGEIGATAGGRRIPFAIASRPLVRTPGEARALRRPVVYVQGNIHGGEVEGKEALLMLLRDLAFEQRSNVLDSLVLIAVPVYNIDGNEDLGPQARNRPEQNGPAVIGRRPNGAGRDLNRDYIKAEAPETRASLAMFNSWAPDVFVDLHTTDGSMHGYALTYSPPLNPASPLGALARDGWLPALRARMLRRHGMHTFDYGNFGTDSTPWQERLIFDTAAVAWTTFDSRPRFSTNYYGLRNGIGILAEAYSHDPFARRVAVTYAFTRELLSLVAEQGPALAAARQAADGSDPTGSMLPIRARHVSNPPIHEVRVEEIERTGDSVVHEAGMRPGLRRTGRFRGVQMPAFVSFEPALSARLPRAYIVSARLEGAVAALRAHGVQLHRLDAAAVAALPRELVREFFVDSVQRSAQPFEGHRQTRVEGSWRSSGSMPAVGDHLVPLAQPLGRLAAYLLEPQSDDGLLTWNLYGDVSAGTPLPVLQLLPAGSP
ncbi:MAG TPA: M14 family metallopeptidase [Gemmatimonadaceae bacterium]